MKKIYGILGLLVAVCLVTTAVNGQFVSAFNLGNLIRWTALFGFISIGVSFVIITGGIDLSIGSVIALTGCLLPMFLAVHYEPTNQSYVVGSVEAGDKTVALQGDAGEIVKNDRLKYSSSTGKPRYLTVLSTATAKGQTTVKVREIPSQLKSGSRVTPEHMRHMNIALAILLVMLVSVGIGLTHGLLITKMKLQPFVVTLCGLMVYRGYARYLANDQIQGFGTAFDGLKYFATGQPFSFPVPFLSWISGSKPELPDDTGIYRSLHGVVEATGGDWIGIPTPVLMIVVVVVAAIIFLNYSIYGRYLLALGCNEQAARFSGINTDRMVIVAYVICSGLAGFTGMLFALDLNSIQPASHANFYELYAIAAAVLGGCSLRGGDGSILGVLIGAAVMRVLYNSINLTGIPPQLEFVIIGVVIMAGVVVDELVKRLAAKRRAMREAAQADMPDATKEDP